MKILKNNYKNFSEQTENYIVNKYPVAHSCEWCESEFEYDKNDTYIGAYGAVYVNCPCCKRDNLLDNEDGITLTKDNVKFPQHFTQFDTVDTVEISDEEIQKWIKEGIEYFRRNKDEDAGFWFSGSGDSLVHIYKFIDDDEYNVVVSKNYYETYIPFQECDYKK